MALKRGGEDCVKKKIEFEMPLRLESIDNENQNNVALLHGPSALFAVDEIPPKPSRKDLLSATALSSSSSDWVAKTAGGMLTFRPFSSIMSEGYRLYNRVES